MVKLLCISCRSITSDVQIVKCIICGSEELTPLTQDFEHRDKIQYFKILVKENKSRKAIREIFKYVLDLAEQNNWSAIDNIFEELTPRTLPLEVELAFLSITSLYKNNLPSRKIFLEALIKLVEEEKSELRVIELFSGL